MQQIDGLWYPTKWYLSVKQMRETAGRSKDWHLAIPYIRSWDCAIDGGAHVGTWTIELCKRFGTVHAFEPDPDNFECLQKNTEGLNVVLHREALGKHQGTGALVGEYSTSRYVIAGNSVRVVTIDSFRLSPGFIKLDVEGHEYPALMGAKDTLKSQPVVLLEDKHYRRYGKSHPAELLVGYSEVAAIHRDRIYAPKASPQDNEPMTAAAD